MAQRGECARFVVSGLVQGVGFRWWTRKQALSCGVRGWVRNCEDGSVESLAIADVEALNMFESLLRRGPRGSRVDHVSRETRVDADDGMTDFAIRN